MRPRLPALWYVTFALYLHVLRSLEEDRTREVARRG